MFVQGFFDFAPLEVVFGSFWRPGDVELGECVDAGPDGSKVSLVVPDLLVEGFEFMFQYVLNVLFCEENVVCVFEVPEFGQCGEWELFNIPNVGVVLVVFRCSERVCEGVCEGVSSDAKHVQ